MNERTKKNILDLQFQKYLVIASTSVIIAFTYIVGISIALFSEQIQLNDFIRMIALFAISAGILGYCSILFYNSAFHLKNILKLLKDL